MKSLKRLLALMLVVCMLVGVLPTMSVAAADAPAAAADDPLLGNFLEISQGNDLSTVGSNAFNVFMYDNTFSGTFGDQHMGGIELSLNGTRIATNGDLHLLPTPEQWDATPAPSKGQVTQDRATNTVTVPMTFNSGTAAGSLRYNLVASPTKDGLRLRMILTSAMPEGLQGKARFNLEFLPASYKSKTYRVDLNADGSFDRTGIFPLHPQDALEEVERADLNQQWYVKDWNTDRGNAQPLPFATGYAFDFAPEDSNCNIKIVSNNADQQLELYDGRNRAQNGWFVLSTEITATDAGDVAADWLITPNVVDGWVRPANVGFSQVGYAPEQKKFAVVELDKFGTIGTDYPAKIGLYRVNADGSETPVKEATLSESSATAWMRYKHIRFDFSDVKETGLYRIKYGDKVCEIFPIENDVYDNVWQSTLSGFLAVQMDHMELREGYKIWHGAAHMDDAGVAIGFSSYFDGMGTMGTLPASIQEKFPDAPANQSINHVDGLNKGGWFDAGDFDIQGGSQTSVMSSLISAAEAYNNMDGYDTLTVTWDDETGGSTEMHRPDGIPDVVEQVIHGSKNMLAQYECLGGIGGTVEVRTLRQYTHLGDPSSDTDGYIYDPALGEDEIVERDGKVYSGKPDDRWLMLNGGGRFMSEVFNTYAKFFAGTAYLAGQYADKREDMATYAAHIMGVANDVWVKEHNNAQPNMNEWDTLIQYALATKVLDDAGIEYSHNDTLNYEFYKARLDGLFSQAVSAGVGSHVNLLFLKPILSAEQWKQVEDSAKSYVANYTSRLSSQTYGVNLTSGSGWGRSPDTFNAVRNISLIYSFFPDENLEEDILNAVNYLLGRHPATNASWISGVGTKSALHPYNSNRGDESFIPGSILPGYITFSDYAESLDDFSFLWFEGESIITYQADWLPVGIAAGRIAHKNDKSATAKPAETKDFDSSLDVKLVKKTISSFMGGSSQDGYLADDGFNVFMYSTGFDNTFGDQHCAGIELVQNGRRIATNGDIHLLPTPEQWDATPAPVVGERTFDEATNTITVPMTLPAEKLEGGASNPEVKYQLISEPEEGGVKLTLKLDGKLPADLVGKAGFNLEFLPAVFIGKSFQADTDSDGAYDSFGVFPLVPFDDMEEIGRARTANQSWYVQQWNDDRGDYQPLPFAEGTKMTFAAEDDDYRIRISCDDGLALYDGRNRAQNGWFVLRTLIPENATEIVWHISADTKENWTRKPNITHSQVGYEPEMDKVAVLELDMADAAKTEKALIKKMNDNGTYTTVKEVVPATATTWKRYAYRNVDFSDVKEAGTYVIEYGGVTSDPFPIGRGVYANIWQQSLSNYMAVQMDHMRIREGYKIWRNPAHMDDALQAPTNMDWFDGAQTGQTIDTKYKPYEHIPGLDVGGFSDAGDFDIQTQQNINVVNSLALAYETYENDYDTLDIDWNAHNVELHRPDGMADLQQLAKHGALNLMAQQENIGFLASVIEVPTLRQYTHLGDGSKDTDGKIYDPALDEGEINGLKAGLRDDRLAFAFQKTAKLQVDAAAALASTGYILREVDPTTSEKAIKMAEQMWAAEDSGAGGGGGMPRFQPDYWGAAISLYKATGKDEYKNYITSHWDEQMATTGYGAGFSSGGWKAVRVLDQLGDEYKTKFETVLKSYAPRFDTPTANNPFGVADTYGMWGGSGTVVKGAMTQAVLHHYYPDVVGTDAVFRAINYILGTHPYNSTSWISGVGNTSVEKGYGSNRAERYYIAGGLAPGYVTIAPDFPEHMDDFNFLWFENEYTVEATADWILLSMGADDYADENYPECEHKSTKDIVKEATCTTPGYTHHICNDCFEAWDDTPTEALGHNWDNGQVTREPTASFDGVKTFTCQRCGATYTERIPATGSVDMSDIDFTDPAAAEGRFIVEEPDVTEAREGQGLYLISTKDAFEPCGSADNSDFRMKDAVKIPVSGDWTATIKVDFDAGTSSGGWDFFGFYAMADDNNGAGIRGGNRSMQSWIRTDGAVISDNNGGKTVSKNDQGLTCSDVHYMRIRKTGDTYECYWSTDGDTDEDFGEPVFTYEDTGIEASYLFLDAYSPSSQQWAGEGYTYYVEYCHFTDVSGAGGSVKTVDFADPDAMDRDYTIRNKTDVSTVDENGLYMTPTTQAFEPCVGYDANGRQDPNLSAEQATTPEDVVEVPVSGDWTATLYFDFANNGGDGSWAFLGFYGMTDDYQNGAGIRAGDGNIQNFVRKDGDVTADTDGIRQAPGLQDGEYWFQIRKSGNTYTCVSSRDGSDFTDLFVLEGPNVEPTKLVIDAYSGRGTGYIFHLKKLVIEGAGGGAEPAAKPEVASIKVNGTALAGFDPAVKTYNVKVAKTDAAPTVTADPGNSDTKIEIDKSGMSADGKTGTTKVVATAGNSKQTYSIAFNYAPESDYFADGAMNKDLWTILNEQKDPTEAKPDCYYRFDQGVGLVMKTQHNSIYRSTSKEWTNVFTMAAQGDWEVVAKAYYKEKPKDIYQQVQLLGWQDEDNYIRINCQYPTAESERGQLRIEPAYEKNAHFDNDTILNVSFVEDTNDTFYFKMKKDGTKYTVSYSTDCKTWIDGGTVENLNYLDPKVGLFITQDHSNDNQVELAWEYVAVTSIDGKQQMTDAAVLEWAAQQVADYVAADLPARTDKDLTLSAVPHGYTVELASSNPAVIGTDGKITVPAADAEVNVTVTVKGADGNVTATATKTITVSGAGGGEPTHDNCPSAKFTDVAKDPKFWYHVGIDYMVEKGYMNGTDATTFKPTANIKRGDLVQILYRIEKEPDVSKLNNPFKDIQKDYYKNAITWAADKGIVTGKTDTKFGPEEPITREQLAAMLYRWAKATAPAGDKLADFPDGGKVQSYAKAAMNWAVDQGIITGVASKDSAKPTLSPQGNANRAQIAVMLERYLNK